MEKVNIERKLQPWKALIFLLVGLLLFGWIFNTPGGLLGKADAVGYAVCHRIDLRSFHLGERQLPLCARCSGMYLGAVLGIIFQMVESRRKGGMPPLSVAAALVLLVAAFGVDGLNSYFSLFPGFPTLYEPQNWLRVLTGTGMGLVIAAVTFPAFNQTVWKNWKPEPALNGLGLFGLLSGMALLLDLVVLTENPLVLYPLAIISAAGVLLVLTMVYSMVWLMVFRSENLYHSMNQMIIPLTGGFGFALLQIVLLDLVRYIFTGTWDGFHLG